ncbi:MAG: adenylate/guanylate cyclase domain-containing protein [Myxococcaceae bacterium]|nr:adenylate/guanylate cyclase domain-containing protein [Myxococcaceae bacterium]
MKHVWAGLAAGLMGCATPTGAGGASFTKADLDASLDARIAAEDRGDGPGATAAGDALSRRMEPWAVFISDMSGFSKLTREKGIAWFLSQIRRMERVALPLLARHQVELVKQYGDDLFIVSKDPARLVAFARDFLAALEAERAKGHPLRVSIGIASGEVLRVGADLFGEPVNRASKLGEDLGEPGELLLGVEVFEALGPAAGTGCVLEPEGTRGAKFPFARCGEAPEAAR